MEKKMDIFQKIIYILFLWSIHLQGGDCGTVQTTASLTGTIGGPVDFTCTYTLGANESVISSLIIWKAETQSAVFENIATFSPPGGDPPKFLTTESALKLRDRTDLLNVTDMGSNSYSVVMRVREVECSDENKYQCSVTFMNPSVGPVLETSETVFTAQAPGENPYNVPVPNPSNIEENMKIDLSCTANVGKPPGQIKWWRFREGITAPVLMGTSSETPQVQAGVCDYNVTFSIQPVVTKDDDQSVWRCSVDNVLLSSVSDLNKPNQETERINVYYKVGVPSITNSPNNLEYSVGSSVTLTCTAKGNPSPDTNIDKNINKYEWTFKANSEDNATVLTAVGGQLTLNNLQESQTGTYTCTAFNGFNGKVFNSSASQMLQIVKTTTTSTTTPSTIPSTAGPTGNPVTEPRLDSDGGLSGGAIAGIVIGVIVILVLIAVAVVCFCKSRQSKADSFEEPPEKPIRNNQNLAYVTTPDIVNNDKSSPFYQEKKQYNTDMQYADLTFDDKPRSRKPIQLYDTGLNNSPYTDVMMPSV
ncbi:cell adhesion molecule 2-like isoform X2 [Crassostrea virginica]